jgi:hypothetical protein
MTKIPDVPGDYILLACLFHARIVHQRRCAYEGRHRARRTWLVGNAIGDEEPIGRRKAD